MKELGKIKDSYDFSFDARKLGLVLLGASAVAALVFGRFCLGSFVYHVVRGRITFAVETLPWRRGA